MKINDIVIVVTDGAYNSFIGNIVKAGADSFIVRFNDFKDTTDYYSSFKEDDLKVIG